MSDCVVREGVAVSPDDQRQGDLVSTSLVATIVADVYALAEKLRLLKATAKSPEIFEAVWLSAMGAIEPLGRQFGKSEVNDVQLGGIDRQTESDAISDAFVDKPEEFTGDARPGLDKTKIETTDLANRQLKSALYNDVILIFLHENRGRKQPVILRELELEFERLGHKLGASTVRTRMSRLRKDYLEALAVGGGKGSKAGRYRLSEAGIRAARAARKDRGMASPAVETKPSE
jgi:hypothetical protein